MFSLFNICVGIIKSKYPFYGPSTLQPTCSTRKIKNNIWKRTVSDTKLEVAQWISRILLEHKMNPNWVLLSLTSTEDEDLLIIAKWAFSREIYRWNTRECQRKRKLQISTIATRRTPPFSLLPFLLVANLLSPSTLFLPPLEKTKGEGKGVHWEGIILFALPVCAI